MNIAVKTNEYTDAPASHATSKLKVKQTELIFFTTQLSVMLESGVVLTDALEAMSEQSDQSIFKTVITDIAEKIKSGDSFSIALAKYPRIFNDMFISMVKASEASGKLPEMLEVLSGYLVADADTRKQVKGAMVYPLIMLLMSVAATGSLMFFVLPRFTKIYESKGASLPKLTQLLVDCSTIFGDPQNMAIIFTVLIAIGTSLYYWHKTTSGQRTLDWMQVKTPIFGTMFVDSVLTRSMRIMATMVNTGVSLLDALDVMKQSCGNYHFKRLFSATDAKIRDGYQLSDAIQLAPNSHLVAPGIIQMLKAGEKS